jgi:hypothetical protein
VRTGCDPFAKGRSGVSILLLVALTILLAPGCAVTKKTAAKKDISTTPFDDTRPVDWHKAFEVVDIHSSTDDHIQKAYFYPTKAGRARPLIVSLHTWSGDYTQRDDVAELCRQRDINYIHPNFGGANNTSGACCSKLALNEIDEAIDYAVAHANVDTTRVCVIGVSGGGYATLGVFMRSGNHIRSFSAWASISDLVAWYQESMSRNKKYASDILKCTMSEDGNLNITVAEERSPLYWKTPVEKVMTTNLFIHAGIHDGYKGSVPVSHSIDFYNKIWRDCGATDSSQYVIASERAALLRQIPPAGIGGEMGGRRVYMEKHYKNVTLVIFEGGHEMLPEVALREVLGE